MRGRLRRLVVAVRAVLAVACAATALANGRPPAPISVGAPDALPSTTYLGATFGLVLTDDGGETWWWFCEQGIGYAGVFDPLYVVTPDTIWATTPVTITRSQDAGCTFEAPDVDHGGRQPTDLVVAGDVVWATDMSPTDTGTLRRSTDGGATFETVLERDLRFFGVRVAPGDPDRVYAGAMRFGPDEAWLLVSDDGGESFADVPVPDDDYTTLRPAGVGDDPDLVFVFGDHASGTTILRSDDAGQTLVAAEESLGRLGGFARDGENVWASSVADGLWRSTDAGQTFVRQSTPRASGLAFRAPWLYATGIPADGFAIGRSDDGGETFAPVLMLDEIDGPRDCPAGTPQADVCVDLWPQVAFQLGIDTSSPRDAGAADAKAPRSDARPDGDAGSGGDGCGCLVGARP